ncbi:MFS transporter [Cysteiniphilum halobium]|uniref:MFS transporter n=1 Tax=Cysteiniphilum halobium TaxID=2219059 RepID=UPI000E6573C2|nr:MFS transporter [Cysteiniphilum halobium]
MVKPLMNDFHTNATGIGIVSGSYLYAYVLMQIPTGILMDTIGLKRLFVLAVSICSIGLIAFSMSHSVESASISRAVIGAFAAASTIVGFGAVLRYFPVVAAPVLIGLVQFSGNIGDMISGYPIASMVHNIGWRTTSIIIAIIGLIVVILVAWKLPNLKNTEAKAITFIAQIKSLKNTFKKPQVWVCIGFAFFIWTPVQLFAGLWGTSAIALQYHLTTETAAGYVSITWLGVGIGSILIGIMTNFLKSYRIPLIIFTAFGLIFSFFLFGYVMLPLWLLPIVFFIYGTSASGQALSFAVLGRLIQKENIGIMTAVNNMSVMLSSAILDPIVGVLIDNHASHHLNNASTYTASDFNYAFSILPMMFIIPLLLAFVMRVKYQTNDNKLTS